ncbi:MAG: restriction endonuclease subunit S, partial [Christensenellaceae bacterium]
MSKLEELIKELCPDGVEWKTLGKVCNLSAGGDVPKDRFSKDKTEKYSIPIYSNGIGENALYGYTDSTKIESRCVTIAARGTIGFPALRTEPFYPIIRLICAVP